MKTLRIFLCVNPFNALLMSYYASRTHSGNQTNLLFIDSTPKSEILLQLIHRSAKFHSWNHIYDFSQPVSDNRERASSFKHFKRKIRTKPLIKIIYDFLLKVYLHAETKSLIVKIKNHISNDIHMTSFDSVELNLLTESKLNRAMMQLFPSAKVNYFEHGLSDYYLLANDKTFKGNFYCLFPNEYKSYLKSKNMESDFVFPVMDEERGFKEISDRFEHLYPEVLPFVEREIPKEKHIVLVILQNLEDWRVENQFWMNFLDAALKKTGDVNGFHFLIKPHPSQSDEIIKMMTEYFQKRNLSFTILADSVFKNLSIEIIFLFLQRQVRFVFGPFSSSIFYLSHFYKSPDIKYFYSIKPLLRYAENAPEHNRIWWERSVELVEQVFVKNCEEIIF